MAKLVVDVLVNAASAAKDLQQFSGAAGKVESGLRKAAAPAAAALTAITAFGAATAKSASRAEQAMGGLDAVFGANSAQMKAWAGEAATSMGLSSAAYAEGAAKMGAQLKNLGVPMDQVGGQTQELMKLAADLAATYGGTTSEAVDALSAALRGEADPAERYGLALSKSAVNAKMAADGTDKLTGAAKQQAQTQALLALATQQAGGAIGQFARESDSASGSAQIAAAQWENAKAALGTALLPILSAVASQLAVVAGFVTQNATAFQVLIGVIGGIAAAVLAANAALSVYRAAQTAVMIATKAAAAAQWLLNVAMTANPIGLIIAGVVLLVAGFVLLYKKSETFRNAVNALWTGIKVGITAVIGFFKALGTAVAAVAVSIAAWFVQAWNKIKAGAAAAVAFVKAYIRALIAVASAVASRVAAVFSAAWNKVKAVTAAVVNFVKAYIRALISVATSVANRIKSVFTAGFNAIKSAATRLVSAVKSVFTRLGSSVASVMSSIKSKVTAVFSALRSAASRLGSALLAPFRALKGMIDSAVGAVRRLIGALRSIKVPKISLPSLGRSSGSAASLAAPQLRSADAYTPWSGRQLGAAAYGGAPTFIIQTGVGDPEAIARAIEKTLSSAQRRRTGVTLRSRAGSVAAPVGA